MPESLKKFLEGLSEDEAKEIVRWFDETPAFHMWDQVCDIIVQKYPDAMTWE